MSDQNIQEIVKQKYSAAAKQAAAGQVASCGGGGELSCCDPISRDLYGSAEIAGLPEKAVGHLAVEIRQRWRNYKLAKRCWI